MVRTYDVEFLNELARDPELYERTSDDLTAPRETIDLTSAVENCANIFLKVIRGGEPVGNFLALPTGRRTYDVHVTLRPECRGYDALRAGRRALRYIFGLADELICRCPETNPASLAYARRLGFRPLCTRHDWIKQGQRHFSTYLRLTHWDFVGRDSEGRAPQVPRK